MAKTNYHSLSVVGTIPNASEKIDFLLSDFYSALEAQAMIYAGEVSSLPYIIATYGHDPSATADAIEKSLRSYFGRYFDTVSINVGSSDIADTSGYGISIAVEVSQDNKTYQVADTVVTDGKNIKQIIKHNNQG